MTDWNGRVTEFNDPLKISEGKVWLKGHDDAVLGACVQWPSMLVTTSRDGKIGFWRLETGQLKKTYSARTKPDTAKTIGGSIVSGANFVRSSLMDQAAMDTVKRSAHGSQRSAAVACHLLRARPQASGVGTLLVATRNGIVQLWCTHKVPAYVAQFKAAHSDGDYVTSMASDDRSTYLFTSFDSGYVKTWLVVNFGQRSSVDGPLHSVTRFS